MYRIYNRIIETLILALVQGITEWLPISSSGHLVIVQEWMGLEELPLLYPVTLHVGTLCVVLLTFRKDIAEIFKALVRLDFKSEEGKLALYIAVGSVPTAAIGFFFHDIFGSFFYSLLAVGIALLATGSFLYISERRKNGRELGCLDSLLMGIAQGVAIIPGISRSGATITTGLLRRVEKEKVFRYSFLLSIPATIGAAVTESVNLNVTNVDTATLLLGTVTSMIVGYASLKLLSKIVLRERLHLFAYYCWIVGMMLILYWFAQPV
ncbi:MAG: undecaprenyl-diphosphate phosphatase [Candidatus Bathyarchaeota archaeon]|nr:undecaprenyl-diphosphate phosphatase [Candidatus Bathyarchaeota archaeon]